MRHYLLCVLLLSACTIHGQIYSTIDGNASFTSYAPLEIINASSESLVGVLDSDKNQFAFKIFIKSFSGFNNPMQRIHFYENYLETDTYPESKFTGKIIEEILEGKGTYRAKGILEIHGIQNEVIINVELLKSNDDVQFNSKFSILLRDYQIDIPRIVEQKIAKEINVHVSGMLRIRE